jgi:uncharacterized protein (DUF4415 family)
MAKESNMSELPKRKVRGKAKKPALMCTSIRLPVDTMMFYKTNYPHTMQAKMREVLHEYVIEHNKQETV